MSTKTPAQLTEALLDSLRRSRNAVTGMGGTIAPDAGFKALPEAINGIEPDVTVGTVVDSAVAYRKQVPANSTRFCYLNSIGGMTYKGFNFDATVTETGGEFWASYDFTFPKAFNLPAGGPWAFEPIIFGITGATFVDTTFIAGGTALTAMSGGCTVLGVTSATTLRCIPRFVDTDTGAEFFPPECFGGLRDTKVTEVVSYGANIIPFPYYDKSKTSNGITAIVNDDGSITFNGTASARTDFILSANIPLSPNESYTLSASTNNNWANGLICSAAVKYDANLPALYGNITSSVAEKVLAKGYKVSDLRITIPSGTVCDNFVFKLMLNLGTTALPYAPYRAPITYTLPDDIQAKLGKGVGLYCDTAEFANALFITEMATAVFNGTEAWMLNTASGTSGFHFAPDKRPFYIDGGVNALCSHYNLYTLHYTTGMPLGTFKFGDSALSGTRVWIRAYDPTGVNGFKDLDEWKAFLAAQYANGTPLTVTYITIDGSKSALNTDFNPLIEVEAGGYIEFVNEYGNAVPSTVTFQTLLK